MHTIFKEFSMFKRRPGRYFSSMSREITCSKNPLMRIKLIKCTGGSPNSIKLVNEIIESHPNSWFVFATPSQRIQHENSPYIRPGHSGSFITDKNGRIPTDIDAYLSKRRSEEYLGSKPRVYDSRFNAQELGSQVRLYAPLFTSIPEELQTWHKLTEYDPNYPLFIHIVPLCEEAGITAEKYRKTVAEIKEKDVIYSLFSFESFKTVRAQNCNEATWRVWKMMTNSMDMAENHDMSCQEMVINIMKSLMNHDVEQYLQLAEEIGLTDHIEKPQAYEGNFEPVMVMG